MFYNFAKWCSAYSHCKLCKVFKIIFPWVGLILENLVHSIHGLHKAIHFPPKINKNHHGRHPTQPAQEQSMLGKKGAEKARAPLAPHR